MRQDAFRSLEHQEMAVIPQWIAGHADPGSMAQLDRALSRWLAKQTPERNQRVGYARKGIFTLSAPITEEAYAARNQKSNRMRSAKKLGLKVRNEAEYLVARAQFEEKRIAAMKAAKDIEIAARIAALPDRIVEAYDLLRVEHRNWNELSRAEWVATLPPDQQDHILSKREFAKLGVRNRKQNDQKP
jgi:hypothetical protein